MHVAALSANLQSWMLGMSAPRPSAIYLQIMILAYYAAAYTEHKTGMVQARNRRKAGERGGGGGGGGGS